MSLGFEGIRADQPFWWGGGVSFLLRDFFNTARAAGAVDGTAAEPGIGVRHVTDVDGDNVYITPPLVVNAPDVAAWNKALVAWSQDGTNGWDGQRGRAAIFRVTPTVLSAGMIGLSPGKAKGNGAFFYPLVSNIYVYHNGTARQVLLAGLSLAEHVLTVIQRNKTGAVYYIVDGSLYYVADAGAAGLSEVFPLVDHNALSAQYAKIALVDLPTGSAVYYPVPLVSHDHSDDAPRIADVSGNGHDGVATKTGLSGDGYGVFGGDGYVDLIAAEPAVNYNEVTFFVWANNDDVWPGPNFGWIFSAYYNVDNRIDIVKFPDPTTSGPYIRWRTGGVWRIDYKANLSDDSVFSAALTGSQTANKLRSFVNGAQLGTDNAFGAALPGAASVFSLGSVYNQLAGSWIGSIGPFAVFNRALTPTEISDLHAAGRSGCVAYLQANHADDLIALWGFGETYDTDGKGHLEAVTATGVYGDDLFETGEGDFEVDTGHWLAYGSNTIAVSTDKAHTGSKSLKITYVDSANGAYVYLNDANALTADLVVGNRYELRFWAAVNTGSVGAEVIDGSGQVDTEISATDLTEVVLEFTCYNATGCFLRIDNMGAGEIAYVDSLVLRQVLPQPQGDGHAWHDQGNWHEAGNKGYLIPQPGAELHDDGNAASDPNGNEANTTTGWTQVAGTLSSVADPSVGDYALKHVNDTGNPSARMEYIHAAADDDAWYRVSADYKSVNESQVTSWGGVVASPGFLPGAAYATHQCAVRTNATTINIRHYASNLNDEAFTDNLSLRKLPFNALIRCVIAGDTDTLARVKLTITDEFQGGLVVSLDDPDTPQNCIHVWYDRIDNKVYAREMVSGTWQADALAGVAATYSAGAYLEVRRIGDSVYVFYNGTYVGSFTTTVPDTGDYAGVFLTDADSYVEDFQVFPTTGYQHGSVI